MKPIATKGARVPDSKTELVDVTLRVAMSPEMITALNEVGTLGGLTDFYWEVFCMRKPLGKWADRFVVVDVVSAEPTSK